MSTDVVRIRGLSKRFVIKKTKSIKERVLNPFRARQFTDEFWALSDIDLDIESGSTIGLIGPNGSGKSTLLKMIGGILQPTSGTVDKRGAVAALLELGAGFHPDLTGRENVFLNAAILGLTQEETEARFDDIVAFSEIEAFIDTQVKFYSSGMYVRLAFAVAIHSDPDILLVDEVLAVGDEAFQKKCLDRIRQFQEEGRTIVLVTHTLGQVRSLCTRAIVLARGSIIYDGDPDSAVDVLRDGLGTRARTGKADALVDSDRVRIGRASLVDAFGAQVDSVRAGDDVRIRVNLSGTQAPEDWSLGIQLNNMFGQMVIATSTSRLGVSPPELNSSTCVDFVLPDAQLGHGRYSVQLAAHAEGGDLDRVSDALIFDVDAGREVQGPLYSPIRLEVARRDDHGTGR